MSKIPSKQFLLLPILFIFSITTIFAEEINKNPHKQTDSKNVIIELNEPEAPLDLKWLVQEATEHNPEIIAAQKRLNAAKAKITQAKSLDDPSIRAGSYDMSNSPININGQTEMLQQRYSVSQKIPFPGKLRLKGEVAVEEA
ncbi:MAG: TolC family protein, partial [Planctomycetota bacterium]